MRTLIFSSSRGGGRFIKRLVPDISYPHHGWIYEPDERLICHV